MLHHIDKTMGIKYTFIVKSDWIKKISGNKILLENDVYKKYNSTITDLSGELIICNDLTKLDEFCIKIVQETYQEYLEFISKRDFIKEKWIYNILDGISEQNKILYQDDKIVICPNYTWDEIDMLKMHILTFPKDKSIHSIRDLHSFHLELLNWIKEKTYQTIKLIYGFDSNIIKVFLHYAPSTYHLHVHFVLISNKETNSSVEYSHNLSNVIENIKIYSNYYQIVKLDKRI